MKKYKYIGTEEQLMEFGFEMQGFKEDGYSYFAVKNGDNEDSIFIPLNNVCLSPNRIIKFNLNYRDGENITPYIQDLIDANLVEVVEWCIK